MKSIIFTVFSLLLASCIGQVNTLVINNEVIHVNQLSEVYLEYRSFPPSEKSISPREKFTNQQIQVLMKILSKGKYNKDAIRVHYDPAFGSLISYIILVTSQGEKIEIQLDRVLSSSHKANLIILSERDKNKLTCLIELVKTNKK